jgi:hypothetical protein
MVSPAGAGFTPRRNISSHANTKKKASHFSGIMLNENDIVVE